MAEGGRPEGVPLVLHVIPTRLARGAQLEARALADHLDAPRVRRHRVLSLFDGPSDIPTDFSLDHPGGVAPGVGFAPRLAVRLRSTLTTLAPAVVVAHGSEPLKYLVPAMIGHRRPLLYYAIGTYSGSDRRLQLATWRHLAARADLVVAEGDEVAQEWVHRFGVPPGRVVSAPNGRDPEVFHPGNGSDGGGRPLVLFVGALTSGKRPDRFVEVVADLRVGGASLRAGLIGDGPLRDAVAGAAVAAEVELLGARSDVQLQMQRADILVFPSRPAGEGMPGVLIEAGLSGLPVVATAVPGVRSIVEDGETGFIVGVDDRAAMVAATARLLDDAGLRSRMGRAARARCLERFSMQTVGDRWIELLRPLLAEAASPPRPA